MSAKRQQREQRPAHPVASAQLANFIGRGRSCLCALFRRGDRRDRRRIAEIPAPRRGRRYGFERSFSHSGALPRRRRRSLLDRLAQIFFHDRKLRDHLLDASRARRRRARSPSVSSPRSRKPFEQRPRRRRQEQPLGAAVVGIGAALDQAAVAKPVEQPGQRDRLQIEHFGEFGLLETLEAVEPRQHRPLGPGDSELAALWSA